MNLLIDESPLVILPSLAQKIGLDEAIVIQQVHYLVNASANVENIRAYQDKHYWVFNSMEQWQAKYFKWWSIPTVKRIFQGLSECNLLITGSFNGGKAHKRLWYRVNHPLLEAIARTPSSDFPPNRSDRIKMIGSIWSDQNDPNKGQLSDQNDLIVSDQNDPNKGQLSDQNDPLSIYKRSDLKKNSLNKEGIDSAIKISEAEVVSNEIEDQKTEEPEKPASLVEKPAPLAIADKPSLGSIIPPAAPGVIPTTNRIDPFYKNVRKPTGKELQWGWLPEGDWKVDGELYPVFREWLAQQWAEQFRSSLHKARADVVSHFINHPEKLPFKWEEYRAEHPLPSDPIADCGIDFAAKPAGWHEHLFDRDYIGSKSLAEFDKKFDYAKAWRTYAIAAYPHLAWDTVK